MYSIKLKLEFGILNKLIAVVKARNPDLFNSDGIQLGVLSDNKVPTIQFEVQHTSAAGAKEADRDSILPIQSPVDDTFKLSPPEPKKTKDQNSSRLPVVLWRQDASPGGPTKSDINASV